MPAADGPASHNHDALVGRPCRRAGFSLIELAIAMAVIALLAGLAYTSYRGHVLKARRADGHALLMEVMAAQERYYARQDTYTGALTDLGYAADRVMSHEGFYEIQADTCGSQPLTRCVRLTASPRGSQIDDARCGALTLDSYGTRVISGPGELGRCW